jgi:steroid delta-isomerase-like uncharacterized protein
MSAELKRLAQRFYDEVLNAGQLNILDELLAPGAVYHNPALGPPANVEGAKQRLAELRSAFPDLRYTVEDMTADEDRVVVQFVLEGTQHGEFEGIAPTGKTVRTLGLTSYRFTERRIAEVLVLADFVTVLRQLDVLPMLPQGRPARRPEDS